MYQEYDNLTEKTEDLCEDVSRCESIEELRDMILPRIKEQSEQWKRKINEIFNRCGLNKNDFAKKCGISRQSLYNWLDDGSLPKNRETLLRLGLLAGYDEENMNRLLCRYGKFPGLYSKSLEDCVCIYVMRHFSGEEALPMFDSILKRIRNNIIRDKKDPAYIKTEILDEKLSDVRNEDELERFISEYSAVFETAYNTFCSYVMITVTTFFDGEDDNVFTLANGQGWTSSLKQTVYSIKQKDWYPTRKKVISLGLHLGMDLKMLNELLELAHLEPLCVKNPLENAIMYVLVSAEMNDYFKNNPKEFTPDAICNYAKDVLGQLDDPEINEFLSEVSGIPEYDYENQ